MMHLKFPLPVGYFPKFELTPDETLAYKELVTDLVKDTRREYDLYVTTQQRHVDGRKWKLAKSKEKLHFYKRRSEFGAAAIGLTGRHRGGSMSSNSGSMDRDSDFAQSGFTPSNSSSRTRMGSRVSSRSDTASPARTMSSSSVAHHHGPHKRLLEPTLLATGVVDGTVDDFVYAFHEPTADDTKSVAAMVGSDGALVDTVVLHTIKCSKTTYLGLKWKLCRTPGGNRDFCFLEYVGVAHDVSGTRYGFRVLESVKLRNCPPFADNSIIRTDISFCYLFRESGEPGVIDVYMHGAFDSSGDAVTAGGVGDSRSTMDMLLEVERCVEVAEAKKLAALVAKQASAPKPKTGSALCSICRAKAGMLSSHLNCQGCGAVICSKCRVKKTIVQTKRGATNRLKISCCKICLVHCKDTSPFEGEQISTHQQPPSLKALARKPTASSIPIQPAGLESTQELALALPTAHHHHSSSQSSKPRTASKSRNASLTDTDYSSSMQSWPSSSVSSTYSELDDSSYVSESQLAMSSHYHHKMPAVAESPRARMQYRQQHQQQYQPQYTYVKLADGTMVDASSVNSYAQRSPPPPPPPMQPTNLDQHRAGLYNQMLELQMQAERAYNLANQNATLMHQQQ